MLKDEVDQSADRLVAPGRFALPLHSDDHFGKPVPRPQRLADLHGLNMQDEVSKIELELALAG
jgi:hypothetical protein